MEAFTHTRKIGSKFCCNLEWFSNVSVVEVKDWSWKRGVFTGNFVEAPPDSRDSSSRRDRGNIGTPTLRFGVVNDSL